MFKSTRAKTVAGYIDSVPKERRNSIIFLHKFIQGVSSKFKPYFAYNMLGYGKFKYVNYKKDIIDWPIIALANQKNYFSIYVCAMESGKYIAESNKSKLGKVSVGRSCIRFKRLEDLNLPELKKVLQKAAKSPGLH